METHMRKFMPLAIAGGIAVLLAGCGVQGAGGSDDDIVIGMAGDFTGDYAAYDAPLRDGAQLAVDEINAAGGVNGRQITFLSTDTQGDQTQGVRATENLIDEGATYLIGTTASSYNAQAAVACEAGIPVSTGDLTAPSVVSQAGDCAFQLIMADNSQAGALADEAIELGYKTAFLLQSSDHPYPEGLPIYFQDAFEKAGGEVVGIEQYSLDAGDFSVQATKIAALEPQPDIVFSPMWGADQTTFIKQLRAAGVTSLYLTSDVLADPSVLEAGSAVEGAIGTAHGWPEAGNAMQAFFDAYEKANGEPPASVVAGLGYNEVKIVAQIVAENGGDSSAAAIIEGLKTLVFTGTTGELTMDPDTRIVSKEITFIEIEDGAIKILGTRAPSFVPDPLP
jgi:branched-chain amino acid transport system substrate-binding protein